ncbi:probable 2-oxoglutarate-dependent dioxygenase AOP1 [Impatiens glandulifera]|uniref:probable 2-oxoglutarate-dependent dioxygenase AOP1 n=1 Tax=Impatiens glandulifera TaxID=253017 RepID=UPI001FB062A0|nr:probable 2-oxoglutarate-dependent dioxygenase AOP1 [Impatiens glandulifera]
MGTQTLPFIDFAEPDLKPGSASWDSIRDQVRRALEEYGCFEAFFPKIPLDLRKQMFSSLEELFDLPLQTKFKNFSEKPYHGYIGPNPLVPLYESMGIEGANMVDNVDEFTRVMWPEGNTTFCKAIHLFSKRVSELDEMVRRMSLESIGVEKYLEEHMTSTNYLLRVQKYNIVPAESNEPEPHLGIRSHTDKNVMTILYQNEVDGLEVMTKDGEWIDVHYRSPDSFIVLVGDSLHGYDEAGEEARYSLGLFTVPNGGYIIKAPNELINEDHPLLFKPYDHAQFLSFYYTPQGLSLEHALKAYCGYYK